MAINFFITNKHGRIVRHGSASNQYIVDQTDADECLHIGNPPSGATHFDGSNFTTAMPQPTKWHTWSDESCQWVLDNAILSIMADEVRETRNLLLQACDWTQLIDVSLQNQFEWVEYRKLLRDVPSQPGFPTNVVWPISPE